MLSTPSSVPDNFAVLGLCEPLLRAVADSGYTIPTPIQAQAIPLVLQGGDLLAAAQTGTGKTAGFTLPLLQRLINTPPVNARPGRPRALVLTPTRELAAQVEESVKTYSKYVQIKSMVMFGGVAINPQMKTLRARLDILVATPGRLLDHIGQKTVDLSGIEILVLDEADRMLDMGFIRDIRKLLALMPKVRQNLLFSATFSDEIKALADGLLNNPAMVEVARRNTSSELVAQRVHLVDRDKKTDLLIKLIKDNNWSQVLVFTRTKHGANRLVEKLEAQRIKAMAIHGNKSQGARTKALAEFKAGEIRVLAATDIAARGLDIDQLPHVVNFELPNVPEDYVHRIGRTGRAGSSGEAVSLVCVDELKMLYDIERLIKKDIEQFTVEGFKADLNVKPEPILRGRQQPQGRIGVSGRPPRRAHQANAGSNSAATEAPAPRSAPAPARHKTHQAPRQEANGNRQASVSSDTNGNRATPRSANPSNPRGAALLNAPRKNRG